MEWVKRVENSKKRGLIDIEFQRILGMKIGQLKEEIKKDEQAGDGKNKKCNDKFFKVLYTPLDGYEIKIV